MDTLIIHQNLGGDYLKRRGHERAKYGLQGNEIPGLWYLVALKYQDTSSHEVLFMRLKNLCVEFVIENKFAGIYGPMAYERMALAFETILDLVRVR